MKKSTKIIIAIIFFAIVLFWLKGSVKAAEYKWPIGGNNASETYKDYDFYGNGRGEPSKNGKTGREYIVDNTKWPNEKAYYAYSESHYGMDITGVNGQTYKVISVVDGKVIATSGTRAWGAGTNFIDRNQRRTRAGLNDGGGYGNYIVIKEESTGRCFLYAHLKGGSLKVKKDDTVKVGQEIAIMGSSGDSGHMHLHFEIRKNQSCTINAYNRGKHSLVATSSNTNLDPEIYIGTKPDVHEPVVDNKTVQISKEDAQMYVKYLFRNVLSRKATYKEYTAWTNKYMETNSIYEVTNGIIFSSEANSKLGELNNLEFAKKVYETILHKETDSNEAEILGYVDKLNQGIWNKDDYLTMICNCEEFKFKAINEIVEDQKEYEDRVNIASEDKLHKLGDLNGDGEVNAADASLCLSLSAKFATSLKACEKYQYAVKYADVNGDGNVNAIDACYILIYNSKMAASGGKQSLAEYMGRTDIK